MLYSVFMERAPRRVRLAAPLSTIKNINNNNDNLYLLCKQALFKMLYEYHLLSQEIIRFRGWQTFSLKGQIVNIFSFTGHVDSVNYSILAY